MFLVWGYCTKQMILRRCYGLKTSFNLLRESGTINFDKSQDTAIEHLSKLSEKLESSNSIWSGFTIDKPKSLYLFGSVGIKWFMSLFSNN